MVKGDYHILCYGVGTEVVDCYLYQHFGGCTGYGHEEAGGREALDQCFAEIFGAESALVRSQVYFVLLMCYLVMNI